ncbi:TetR/AcrR family transcriptional regulator [Saccharopolyspora rhizosphaerae]|uniref:TetR/AcrR family transcriptional regulator n=1 Tax=Saccharopolyspora rhizosphaerae TaxID=2492662 RepID=A0A3R8P352_9PSEU|nr:TetR/AcrR family transcriptional regulator [Saccharopolyspora rhizosphaerae]RRO15385.1 TetR/AcrR family transcriptional regulator [Saccharopolyspora rhizosphaerae]
MESDCHSIERVPARPASPGRRQAANRVDEADLLRAARECVLVNGVRRTTLTEVARTAGVSRMTLYRRFPDVGSMVTTLVTAEFGEVLQQARRAEGTGDARQRLVSGMVRGIRLLHEAPLLQRVLETDAELLLPYLVERLGSTQVAADGFLREHLAAGHADGSIRPGDVAVQARSLLLLTQSFVISAVPAAKDLDLDALTDELTLLLDGALQPRSPS